MTQPTGTPSGYAKGGTDSLSGERTVQVLKAQRTMHRMEEAWDRVLRRERDERVGHTGTPRRHCQVCLMPTIEESPWCSRQCQDAGGLGSTTSPVGPRDIPLRVVSHVLLGARPGHGRHP